MPHDKMPLLATRRRFLVGAAAGPVLTLPGRATAQTTQITGAGSSFVRPVMERWIDLLPATLGVSARYSAIGTGVAQSKILSGDIDFAAFELPLPASTVANGDLIQFPVAFGALACVVNIPGVANDQLKLNAGLLAAIYAGGIKKWNDPRIVAVNPSVALPELDIKPLRLDTPSGAVFSTTYTFTQYLLATNADWREKYGAAVTKRWAVGSMVDSAGNMMETLKILSGSIGYVPLGSAAGQRLTTAMLWNKAGKLVGASLASLQAAVAQVDWRATAEMAPKLLDLPGEATWPIVLPSYVLMQRNPRDKVRGEAVTAFAKFIVSNGAEGAEQRHAVALPEAPRGTVLGMIAGLNG